MSDSWLALSDEVRLALERGEPVVALESSLIAQGLPTPDNLDTALAAEAAVREGWDALIGSDGAFIGMKSFGASGPAKDLYKHFGITPEAVVAAAEAKLA